MDRINNAIVDFKFIMLYGEFITHSTLEARKMRDYILNTTTRTNLNVPNYKKYIS